jgi:hypothetical protein
VRELGWPHTRAFLASAPEEWGRREWAPRVAEETDTSFTAHVPGAPLAVLVRHVCQTASMDWLAIVGGQLTPWEQPELVVRLHAPDAATVAVRSVLDGIHAHRRRPKGLLEIRWWQCHAVDDQAWAWARAGAYLVELLRADVADLADDDLIEILTKIR